MSAFQAGGRQPFRHAGISPAGGCSSPLARRVELARLLVEMLAELVQRRHAASGAGGGGETAARGRLLAQAVGRGPAGNALFVGGRDFGVEGSGIEFAAVQGRVLRSGKREHKMSLSAARMPTERTARDKRHYHLRRR